MSESKITVLTQNCWGLKYVSKLRRERIEALAIELANSEEYDIITLQEIWVFADYEHIRDSVSKRLPYSKFFYSGALGAGLAILSRFPIIGSTCNPYSLNGLPIDVTGGDWFVGKAAASVVINHPVLGEVQVFNTHMYAKGGDTYPHRLINAWEFAKLVKQASQSGRYVIAAGDFNSTPTDLAIAIIREYTDFADSWIATHPSGNYSPNTSPEAQVAVEQYGVTADTPLCSWSVRFEQKRLDYVWYRNPPQKPKDRYPSLRCTDCVVALKHHAPGRDYNFSDHFAVKSTLTIDEPPPARFIDSPTDASGAVANWSEASSDLSDSCITDILQSLAGCYRLSKRRSQRELVTFVVCVSALIAIAVGSAWFPFPWINSIFTIITVVIAWWGTTLLYEGFIFGNWECNALMNIIEELELYKKALELQAQGSSSSH
ncbi:inositol phosphophingolipids phospholipase C [Marasmius fiardii PR-910]|nr:inositol phosphophingolipids phospholipase C [Marasmius fiardii PR-910]